MSTLNKSWQVQKRNWFRYWDGSLQTSSSVGTILNAYRNTLGGPVDDYKGKIREKRDASSNYTRRSLEINYLTPMTLFGRKFNNFTKEWWWLEGEYYLISIPSQSSITDQAFLAKAQMGFVKKLLATRRSLAGAVSLGELAKTLKMIASPARALRAGVDSYLKAVKKRLKYKGTRRQFSRRDRVSDLNKVISGTWLEYQLGMKPLMGDVRDGAQALSRLVNNFGEPTERVQYKAKYEVETPAQPGPTISIPGWFAASTTSTEKATFEISFTGVVKVPLPRDNVAGILGFTKEDILPTIWELIPLSFVTDYIVNVGAILDSFGVLKIEPICLNRSVMTRRLASLVLSGQSDTIYAPGVFRDVVQHASGCQSTVAYVDYTRNTISVGDLIPPLTFKMPGTNTRWINIGALVAQANDITTDILGNKL